MLPAINCSNLLINLYLQSKFIMFIISVELNEVVLPWAMDEENIPLAGRSRIRTHNHGDIEALVKSLSSLGNFLLR